MFVGQKITFINDNQPPLQSPYTDMVLAWVTCGGTCVKGAEYMDTVQVLPDGTEKRQVTWRIDDTKPIEFELCNGVIDRMNFEEFKRRWMSEEWIRVNLNHPIAYIKVYRDNERKVRDWIKKQRPAVLIKRNNKTAIIPADCPEAKKARILAELRS
jgi:hypothetical protein